LKILFDCVGVRDGGAARLLEILFVHLPARRPNWRWVFCVLPEKERDFVLQDPPQNAEVIQVSAAGLIKRIHWLTSGLPMFIERCTADVVFSFANLPPARTVVPKVIFLQQMKVLSPLTASPLHERLRMALLRSYLRLTFSSVTRVIVQSEHMKSLLRRRVPQIETRTIVIQSPVVIADTIGIGQKVMTTLAVTGAPKIAYISLPRSHKNHVTLIRAFARVRVAIPNAVLLLTVEPPGNPVDAISARIHAEARTKQITDGIVWLGLLSRAEVAVVYDAADLIVFPSISESFGLPLAEAVCRGRPVAASDLPFAHEILGEAGIYFNPSDPCDMARTIVNALSNPYRLVEMRTASTARAARFAPEHIAERLSAVLEAAVADKSRA
jgi:glycosyltransferase involved in cell wall biosynthesis